jgi:hypothetical protein
LIVPDVGNHHHLVTGATLFDGKRREDPARSTLEERREVKNAHST